MAKTLDNVMHVAVAIAMTVVAVVVLLVDLVVNNEMKFECVADGPAAEFRPAV